MKKAPQLWKLEELQSHKIKTAVCIGDKWVPARPLGYYSLASRLRISWMVFVGKADAVIWPGGQ